MIKWKINLKFKLQMDSNFFSSFKADIQASASSSLKHAPKTARSLNTTMRMGNPNVMLMSNTSGELLSHYLLAPGVGGECSKRDETTSLRSTYIKGG
jgi:hypothetical protein